MQWLELIKLFYYFVIIEGNKGYNKFENESQTNPSAPTPPPYPPPYSENPNYTNFNCKSYFFYEITIIIYWYKIYSFFIH